MCKPTERCATGSLQRIGEQDSKERNATESTPTPQRVHTAEGGSCKRLTHESQKGRLHGAHTCLAMDHKLSPHTPFSTQFRAHAPWVTLCALRTLRAAQAPAWQRATS
eukprot:1160135-Pelagomonas_calceolata.AAC.4